MLNRDEELIKGWVQIEHPLLIDTKGGKQMIKCANTEGIFRIIQSIPSPKAEPFKRWLARVGYERKRVILAQWLKKIPRLRLRFFVFSLDFLGGGGKVGVGFKLIINEKYGKF